MSDTTTFDYYYGDESSQFSFYRIPRQLITGEQFKRGVLEALDLRKKAIERREAQKSQGDKGPPKKKPGPAR